MSRRPRSKARTQGGFQSGPGTVVTLAYQLFDAEGESVEASPPDAPLVLLLGYGEATPALERALDGASVGEVREVTLAPKDAFGERDPDGFIRVDRSELPPDVSPGDELDAESQDGASVALKVVEVTDADVLLDTNHPLAGQRIRLRAEVLAVRPASDDEVLRATERLGRTGVPTAGALLPAERLLRRERRKPPSSGGDAPPSRGTNPVEKL